MTLLGCVSSWYLYCPVAETDLEAEVDPSVETEDKLRAEEEAARRRLEAMQRWSPCGRLTYLTYAFANLMRNTAKTTLVYMPLMIALNLRVSVLYHVCCS